MNIEQVTLSVAPDNPDEFARVNDADEVQAAADTIASHRQSITTIYQALLDQSNGMYNRTNQVHLTYAQAMNLENYLYMAVTIFGHIQVSIASGAFMMVTGLAIVRAGLALLCLNR